MSDIDPEGVQQTNRVVFVPDEARVVRYSELRDYLEELGSVGMVAQHLGVDASTVSRHLTSAGVPSAERFARRMGNEIERLQAEHVQNEIRHEADEERHAQDTERIEKLEKELKDRDEGV